MAIKTSYQQKIDFYLDSLDELGESLIDQSGSSGLSRSILRIILGTMMTSKGAIISIEKKKLDVLAIQGKSTTQKPSNINENQKKFLSQFKNSHLIKKNIDAFPIAEKDNYLIELINTLDTRILVPLYHRNELTGLVAVGQKFTKHPFSKDDKKILEIVCNHLSDALVKRTLIANVKTKSKELSLKLLQLQTLFDISLAINSILDLGQLVDEVLIRAVSILNGSSGFILLGDSTSPILHLKSVFNITSDDLEGKIFSTSSGEIKKIWRSNKGLNLGGSGRSDLLNKTGYEYALVAPLISKKNVKGIVIVGDKESRSGFVQFENEDLDILSSLASQAGVAIDNAELFQEITNARLFNESIMGSIATGVMTVNLMGEVDSINNAALRLFNKNKRTMIGDHFTYFFRQDPVIIDLIKNAEADFAITVEMDVDLNRGKHDTKINISAAPLTDHEKNHIGTVIAFEDISEQSKIKNTFKRYVSKNVVDQLLSDDQKLNLGGEERDVTILFSDIRGFTSMSERMNPEEVVLTLNEYFSAMIDLIFKYDGTLDKIVGDELMVVYGAPISKPDDSDRAVLTAIDMIAVINRLNNKRKKKKKRPIEVGIGINKGLVISGNIGSKHQMDYTVIGDAVNIGARLCSIAKPQEIIISHSVKEALIDNYELIKMKPVSVKGKEQPILISGIKG